MGTVLDLRERLSVSGDWTAAERHQLWALAARLPADGVAVVFGKTDVGDPWCVVTDADEEVLLHVARIRGSFVVHSVWEGSVAEGRDLGSAVERLGGFGGDDSQRRSSTIPIPREPLHLNGFIALGAAGLPPAMPELFQAVEKDEAEKAPPEQAPDQEGRTLFSMSEVPPVAGPDPALSAPHAQPEKSPVAALGLELQPADLGGLTAADETGPAPVQTSVEVAASAARTAAAEPAGPWGASPPVVAETPAEQPLAGGSGAETIRGGDGPDTLGEGGDDTLDSAGRAEAGIDVLDAGAGADRLFLGPRVVAIGGRGADVFVVRTAHGGEGSPVSLGVVMDFFESRDDRLEFGSGAKVSVLGATSEADVLAALRGSPALQIAPVVTGERLSLDFDGDGREDGYVLLGHMARPDARIGSGPASSRLDAGEDLSGLLHRPGPPGAESSSLPLAVNRGGAGVQPHAGGISAFQLDAWLFGRDMDAATPTTSWGAAGDPGSEADPAVWPSSVIELVGLQPDHLF